MVGLQQLKPPHVNVQIHLLLDIGIAGTQGLDLRIAEGRFVNVIGRPDRGFAGHNLADELLLALYQLVEIAVKGVFRYIGVDFNLLVLVALADDAAFPLLKICRTPGTIQVVQGHQFLLDIGSGSHLCGAAQQHPDFSITHLAEQLLFLLLGVGVVDVGDFLGGDAFGNQLIPQVIVHIEGAVAFGGGEIAEGQLSGLLSGGALPDLIDVVGAGPDLAGIAVRQQRIDSR